MGILHSKVNGGIHRQTDTARWSHKRTSFFFFQNKERRLKIPQIRKQACRHFCYDVFCVIKWYSVLMLPLFTCYLLITWLDSIAHISRKSRTCVRVGLLRAVGPGSRTGLASGICGRQSGVGAGFLRVLRFPLPKSFIPPTSSSQSPVAVSRGLTTSWSPVQGVLPIVLDLVTELKWRVSWRRPRPKIGL
jgi:hypothetical protein